MTNCLQQTWTVGTTRREFCEVPPTDAGLAVLPCVCEHRGSSVGDGFAGTHYGFLRRLEFGSGLRAVALVGAGLVDFERTRGT